MNVSSRVPVLLTMLLVSGLVSACAMRSGNGQRPGRAVVVLLPDPEDGHVGRIVVSNPQGSKELASARASTRVTMTQAPRIRTLSESDVNRLFGEILAYAATSAPTLHSALPVRFRRAHRRRKKAAAGRASGGQKLSRSGSGRDRPHRYHGHTAIECRARSAPRQRRSRAARAGGPGPCRPSMSDRTARPNCSCPRLTASSNRGTAASKSRCDDPAHPPADPATAVDPALRPGAHHRRRSALAVPSVGVWQLRVRRLRSAAAFDSLPSNERAHRHHRRRRTEPRQRRPMALAPRRDWQISGASARVRRGRRGARHRLR